MTPLILILHNIRSTYNVGAILRSADGFGIAKVICSGYTPYPLLPDDTRLPHVSRRLHSTIAKTALGAETTIPIQYAEDPIEVIRGFKTEGYLIVGLEQHASSQPLETYQVTKPTVLILGEEVAGVSAELQAECDEFIEIKMYGHKESFNVSVAASIAMYQSRLR